MGVLVDGDTGSSSTAGKVKVIVELVVFITFVLTSLKLSFRTAVILVTFIGYAVTENVTLEVSSNSSSSSMTCVLLPEIIPQG